MSVTWHFYPSARSQTVGPSPDLLGLLLHAKSEAAKLGKNFDFVIYLP